MYQLKLKQRRLKKVINFQGKQIVQTHQNGANSAQIGWIRPW